MIHIFVDPEGIAALIEFQQDISFVFDSAVFLSGEWMPDAAGSTVMGAGEC
jgi:hypothetical protein